MLSCLNSEFEVVCNGVATLLDLLPFVCVCRELKESQKGGKSIDLDSPNLLRMDTN